MKDHTTFSGAVREKISVFIGLLVAVLFIQAEKILINSLEFEWMWTQAQFGV